MNYYIKNFIRKALPRQTLLYSAFNNLLLNTDSYLYSTGWMNSLKNNRPVDVNGRPVPWMNFSVVSFLNEKMRSDLKVFEYGCGYSTIFYAERVKSVTSVDNDERWIETIKAIVPDNVNLIYRPKDIDGDYCRSISAMKEKYDVIVIDGRDRTNCLKVCIEQLTPGGIIILDDSQRSYYREGIEFAANRGFRCLSFEGLKSICSGVERTTILYRSNNCFDI